MTSYFTLQLKQLSETNITELIISRNDYVICPPRSYDFSPLLSFLWVLVVVYIRVFKDYRNHPQSIPERKAEKISGVISEIMSKWN